MAAAAHLERRVVQAVPKVRRQQGKPMELKRLRLGRNEERRLQGGHLWVYSNEVNNAVTPLKAFAPGELALVESHGGKPMGVAYVNPHSLICARLIGHGNERLDTALLVRRFKQALTLRERLFDVPFYRLVFGESDLLPGLVVDRFGAHLVVQLNTAGMDAAREAIVEALVQVLQPASIVLRNDSSMRVLENLEKEVVVAYGNPPDHVALIENGVKFLAPLHDGQKTGWFYDQRPNRAWLKKYVVGKRVLDVFSYIGGFGVQAAVFGAKEAWCVDRSAAALDLVKKSAELNGVAERMRCIEGDAFDVLKDLKDRGEQFDVVIVDPPAFIKRKKDISEGINAYRRINEAAMRLLGAEGYLLSGSCSMHLQRDELVDILRGASRHLDRHLQIIEEGMQGPDHPVHPAIPETRYIKAFMSRIYTP
jgi:23S rRNA (cytosine1962-C5)-methyltransferase